MVEAGRPAEVQKEVDRLATKAAEAALIGNRFAHGPLDMGINFETRGLRCLPQTGVGGPKEPNVSDIAADS